LRRNGEGDVFHRETKMATFSCRVATLVATEKREGRAFRSMAGGAT